MVGQMGCRAAAQVTAYKPYAKGKAARLRPGKSPPALVAIPRPGNPHPEQGQAGMKLASAGGRLLASLESRVGC